MLTKLEIFHITSDSQINLIFIYESPLWAQWHRHVVMYTFCVIIGNRMVIALSSNPLLLSFNKLCSYRWFEWSTVRGCS